MSDKPIGYVEVDSEELIEACKIAVLYAEKQIDKEKQIEEEKIKTYESLPWHNFWTEHPTKWFDYRNRCWTEYKIIKTAKLLVFAAAQSKTVLVSVESLNMIGNL